MKICNIIFRITKKLRKEKKTLSLLINAVKHTCPPPTPPAHTFSIYRHTHTQIEREGRKVKVREGDQGGKVQLFYRETFQKGRFQDRRLGRCHAEKMALWSLAWKLVLSVVCLMAGSKGCVCVLVGDEVDLQCTVSAWLDMLLVSIIKLYRSLLALSVFSSKAFCSNSARWRREKDSLVYKHSWAPGKSPPDFFTDRPQLLLVSVWHVLCADCVDLTGVDRKKEGVKRKAVQPVHVFPLMVKQGRVTQEHTITHFFSNGLVN